MNPPISSDAYKLICLTLNYNGASFQGWQSQLNGKSIQDALENALFTSLRQKIRVTAASRTDTGVHAEQQVVTFRWADEIDLHRLVRSLNAILPSSVQVRQAKVVPNDFHPIFSSVAKVYRYRIWRAVGMTPFVSPFVWHTTHKLDVEAMREAAKAWVGEHDFTSFCAADSTTKTKVRRVLDIRIVEKGPLLEFWFLGEGFLKQMIRIFVGTLVAVGQGKVSSDSMKEILAAKDRRAAPGTAPPDGLCLVKISYDSVPQLDALLGDSGKGYNLSLDGEWFGM